MRLSISLMLILTSLMSSAQVIVGPTTGQNGTMPKALLDVRASNPAAPIASDGFLLPRLEYFPDADQVLPHGIQEGTLMIYMPGPDVTPEEGRVIGGVYVYTELEAWELLSLSGDGIDDDGDAPCVVIQNNTGTNVLSCSTPEITLTASGAGPHLWNTGATTSSITVNASGTYTVNLDGCNSSASIVITGNSEDGAPTAEIYNNTGTTELTSGVPVIVVEASGGESYLWDTGETTAQLTITEADTYTVTVTAANGCTDTESIVITEEVACETTISEASFENGEDGWNFTQFWGYVFSERSNEEASGSVWSAKLKRVNTWFGSYNGDIDLDLAGVDLSGYSSITVTFDYKTVGFDGNSEKVYLSFRYGDNDETQEFGKSSNGFTQASYTYSGPNIDQFNRILFWTDMNATDEQVYIDEIVITGTCD